MKYKKTNQIPRESYRTNYIFDFHKEIKKLVNKEAEEWHCEPNVIPENQVIKRKSFRLRFNPSALIRLFIP